MSRGLNVILEATEGNCRVLSRRVMIVIAFLSDHSSSPEKRIDWQNQTNGRKAVRKLELGSRGWPVHLKPLAPKFF